MLTASASVFINNLCLFPYDPHGSLWSVNTHMPTGFHPLKVQRDLELVIVWLIKSDQHVNVIFLLLKQ